MHDIKKELILGLDTNSHSTGFSLFKGEKLVDYGKILIPSKFMMPKRLLMFYHELNFLVEKLNPTMIAVEDLQYLRNKNSVNTLAAFLGIARLVSYSFLKEDAILVRPNDIKMVATGKGNAEKVEVTHAANKLFDLSLKDSDDDISDAIFTAYFVIQKEKGNVNRKS